MDLRLEGGKAYYPESAHYIDIQRLKVCATCAGIYGPWNQRYGNGEFSQIQDQKCKCGKGRTGDPVWAGHDFNEIVTLCYCCGQELLSSGSRFSLWFCEECKQLVIGLNTRYLKKIIPIGRHSMMNGYYVKGNDTEKELDVFVENWNGLVNRMDVLFDWERSKIRRHFNAASFANDADLIEYLAAVKGFDKIRAFDGLVEYLRKSF